MSFQEPVPQLVTNLLFRIENRQAGLNFPFFISLTIKPNEAPQCGLLCLGFVSNPFVQELGAGW
jgi:hypothetical protein